MERQDRKPNRLGSWNYGEPGCYFVTLCTHRRQALFQMENPSVGNGLCAVPIQNVHTVGNGLCAVPNQIVHRWVAETQNKFENIKIDKYVVMPDHLHLIVTIQEWHAGRSLPDVMQFFKTMTTNEYI